GGGRGGGRGRGENGTGSRPSGSGPPSSPSGPSSGAPAASSRPTCRAGWRRDMIEPLRARLNAILARVDADPDAAEHDLWEVRRLLAALRPSLGEDAARLGKALDQVELRIATLRVVHVSLDLAARKRVLDRHLDAGAAAAP